MGNKMASDPESFRHRLADQGARVEDIAVNLDGSADAYETMIVQAPAGMEQRGTIACVGELRSAPASSRYLLSLAASTLRHSYFSQGSNRRDHFADALEAVNDVLRREARQGQDQWYGNLALVAIAVQHNDMRVAAIGPARAILIRDGVPRTIESSSESPHALFSAVAMGSLKRGDFVALLPASNLQHVDDIARISDMQVQTEFLKRIRSAQGGALLIVTASDASTPLPRVLSQSIPSFANPTKILSTVSRTVPDPLGVFRIAQNMPALSRHLFVLGTKLKKPSVAFRIPTLTIGKLPQMRLVAAGGGVVAILAVLMVAILAPRLKPSASDTELLANVQQKIDEADSAAIIGTAGDAFGFLNEASQLIEHVPERTRTQQLHTIAEEIETRKLSLEKVHSITPLHTLELPSFPVRFAPNDMAAGAGGQPFFLADQTYAGIWKINLDPKTPGTFIFLPEALSGGVGAVTQSESSSTVLLATPQGIGTLAAPYNTVEHITLFSDTHAPVSAAPIDASSFFVLSPASKTILMVRMKESGAVESIAPWASKDEKLAEARDLAVAQSLYVLGQEGTVFRYSKGKRVGQISVHDALGHTKTPEKIEGLGEELLALDSIQGGIMKIGRDGSVVAQWRHPDMVGAVTFVTREKKIFVLTPKQILEFELPETE